MYCTYLKTLCKHRFFVFLEACRLGVTWLGIIHDLSKFLPDEFVPYARHFSRAAKEHEGSKAGYFKPADIEDAQFGQAWLRHLKRNKHHWQYWVVTDSSGCQRATEMPDRYRREMLADWRGAGRAYARGQTDTGLWYISHKHKMLLGPKTRSWVENELGVKERIEAYGNTRRCNC